MSTVYRVHWTPGSDRLLAVCHCDAWRELDDPIAAWEWLLAHPEGHTGGGRDPARPGAPGGARAAGVAGAAPPVPSAGAPAPTAAR
jgi:hypothetical protein